MVRHTSYLTPFSLYNIVRYANHNSIVQDGELGDTALISAAYKGHTEVVVALLTGGAAINARDKGGFTALQSAALRGQVKAVEQLLLWGDGEQCDVDGVDNVRPTQCNDI